VPDAQRQTNRLRALAESAQMFAEASPSLSRLLEVIARRFAELVGEATNIRLGCRGSAIARSNRSPRST
jgi:hypothetical protein